MRKLKHPESLGDLGKKMAHINICNIKDCKQRQSSVEGMVSNFKVFYSHPSYRAYSGHTGKKKT